MIYLIVPPIGFAVGVLVSGILGASTFIYGSYPEGFDKFAQVINDACGGDREYLTLNEKPAKITEEYFTAITGLTDDDVQGGKVPELIDHLAIHDLLRLSGFLKNRGADGEVTKGKAAYDEQEWYEIKAGNGKSVRVFRTEGLDKFIPQRAGEVDWWYNSFKIYEDTQGPTSEFVGYNAFDFTYSNDRKFAIAVESESGKGKEFFRETALAAKSLEE